MSYVVTNGKKFQEFDTVQDAKKYSDGSKDYGLVIYERDVFGNMNKVSEEELSHVVTEEPKKPEQPQQPGQTIVIQQQPQQQPKKEESKTTKILRIVLIVGFCAVLAFFLLRVIWPMVQDFVNAFMKL